MATVSHLLGIPAESERCPDCDGWGVDPDENANLECELCTGTGQVWIARNNLLEARDVDCPNCAPHPDDDCSLCGGRGAITVWPLDKDAECDDCALCTRDVERTTRSVDASVF